MIYDVSVLTGVGAVTAGVYLKVGIEAALVTFGILIIALSVYGAERLSGR